jgi:hypothetical protein
LLLLDKGQGPGISYGAFGVRCRCPNQPAATSFKNNIRLKEHIVVSVEMLINEGAKCVKQAPALNHYGEFGRRSKLRVVYLLK